MKWLRRLLKGRDDGKSPNNPIRDVYQATNQYFYRDAPTMYCLDQEFLTPIADFATSAPSQLLAARNRVVPFGHRDQEVKDLLGWRDSTANASIKLVHAAGGQGKTRLADEIFTHSRLNGWTSLSARHISDARQTRSEQLVAAPDKPTIVLIDYADRWPIDDLLHLTADILSTHATRIRILLLSRSAEWWPPVRHELVQQGWQTSQLRLTGIESDEENRRTIYSQATSAFAKVLSVEDTALNVTDADLSGPQYELVLSIHMSALALVISELDGVPAPTDVAATAVYLLDRERAYWRYLLNAGQINCQATTMGRALFDAVLIGPLSHEEASRLLDLTGVTSSIEPANNVLDDYRKCYPSREPSTVLQPLYPDRLAEDFAALQIPGSAEQYEPDPWSEFALGRLVSGIDDLSPEAAQRLLLMLVEIGRRWGHVASRYTFKLFESNPSFVRRLGGAGVLRLITTNQIENSLLAELDAALPSERTLEFDIARAVIAQKLLADRLKSAKDPLDEARIIAQLGLRFDDAGDQDEALALRSIAVDHLQTHADHSDERYIPALASHLIDLSGAYMKLERFAEAEIEAGKSVDLYRQMEHNYPSTFLNPLAAALNNFGMATLKRGDAQKASEALEESVRIRESLAEKSPQKFDSMLAASLDNLSLIYAETGRGDEALDLTLRAVDIFRRLAEPGRADLMAELAAALDNLGGLLWEAGRKTESVEAISESFGYFKELSEINRTAFEVDLFKVTINLSQKLWDSGKRRESLELYEDGISLVLGLFRRYPAQYAQEVLVSLIRISLRFMEVDEFESAKYYLQQFVKYFERGAFTADEDSTQDKAYALDRLSICHAELSEADSALDASLESVAAWESVGARDGENFMGLAVSLRNLSLRLREKLRFQESVAASHDSVSIIRAKRPDSPTLIFELALSLGVYAWTCEGAKTDLELAVEAADESAILLHNLENDDDGELAQYAVAALVTKVGLLELLGRRDEADSLANQLAPALGKNWRTDRERWIRKRPS